MSDLVYTTFGYGTIVHDQPKPATDASTKDEKASDKAEPKPEETKEAAVEEEKPADPEGKVVKVSFKWGGIGYLPVEV